MVALWILRVVFILIAGSIALTWSRVEVEVVAAGYYWIWAVPLVLSIGIVVADILVREKKVESIGSIYFGLIVGFLLNFMTMQILEPYFANIPKIDEQNTLKAATSITLTVVFCYTTISFILQTKDDFRFIVPYVQFAREVKGIKPFLLDTSVIIDGRIADVIESGVLNQNILVPKFVLDELQTIANATDKTRKARGRRGLDVLSKMRSNEQLELQVYDTEHPELAGQSSSRQIVQLAKILDGKIITNDYNLDKVADLHSVETINLNELAKAVKPFYLPGEKITTTIVRPGEGPGQGVGYLDDGTMIVVENAREIIGKSVEVSVTRVLQTSAGRMVFASLSGPFGGNKDSGPKDKRTKNAS